MRCKTVVFFVILCAVPTLSARNCKDRDYFPQGKISVTARAGGAGERPANTLTAFEHALNAGADILETDAWLTKDQHIVLIENEDVSTTTDGTGLVTEMTLENVRKLDAGYAFHDPNHPNGPYPWRNKGITVPTLDQMLLKFPKTPIIIEIKGTDPKLVDELVKKLDQMQSTDRFLVASRNEKLIHRFRKAMPSVITAATKKEITSFYILSATPLGRFVDPETCVFQIPIRKEKRKIAEPDFIQRCRRKNIQISVWTINNKEHFQEIQSLDIQGIVTDFPTMLTRWLTNN